MTEQRMELGSVFILASLFFMPLGAHESNNAIAGLKTEEILSEIGAEPTSEPVIEALPLGHNEKEIIAETVPEDVSVSLAQKEEEEVVLEPVAESVILVPEKGQAPGPRVMLTRGTFMVQGAMSFLYKLTGFSNAQHAIHLSGKAGMGYFIKDQVVVGANIVSSLKLFPLRMGEIGLAPFSTYYFAIGRNFYPYVGGDISPRYSLQERSMLLSAGVHTGLLVSIGEHVGLDFGIEPRLHFRLNNQQKWKLEIPIGFFGVKAFF